MKAERQDGVGTAPEKREYRDKMPGSQCRAVIAGFRYSRSSYFTYFFTYFIMESVQI